MGKVWCFTLLLPLLLISITGCDNLPYKSDFGFISAAQANFFGFPIMVNGKLCKDMDDRPGLCVKQLADNNELKVSIPPRPYSYTLAVKCSEGLNFSPTFTIPKDEPFNFAILEFHGLKTAHCILEMFPQDRPQEISILAGIFIKIFDRKYQLREQIIQLDKYLIMGTHARHVTYCKRKKRGKKKCYYAKKKTVIKEKGVTSAFSESDVGRINYYFK